MERVLAGLLTDDANGMDNSGVSIGGVGGVGKEDGTGEPALKRSKIDDSAVKGEGGNVIAVDASANTGVNESGEESGAITEAEAAAGVSNVSSGGEVVQTTATKQSGLSAGDLLYYVHYVDHDR